MRKDVKRAIEKRIEKLTFELNEINTELRYCINTQSAINPNLLDRKKDVEELLNAYTDKSWLPKLKGSKKKYLNLVNMRSIKSVKNVHWCKAMELQRKRLKRAKNNDWIGRLHSELNWNLD